MSDGFVIRGSGGEASTYSDSYGSGTFEARSLGGSTTYLESNGRRAIEALNESSATQAETAPAPSESSAVGALADWIASLFQSLLDWLEA